MKDRKHPVLRAMAALLDVVAPVLRLFWRPWSREAQKPAQEAGSDAGNSGWGERPEPWIVALKSRQAAQASEIAELQRETDAQAKMVEEFIAKVQALETLQEHEKAASKKK